MKLSPRLSKAVEIWWHESSNVIDIVLSDRTVFRNTEYDDEKWQEFRLADDDPGHEAARTWLLIGWFK